LYKQFVDLGHLIHGLMLTVGLPSDLRADWNVLRLLHFVDLGLLPLLHRKQLQHQKLPEQPGWPSVASTAKFDIRNVSHFGPTSLPHLPIHVTSGQQWIDYLVVVTALVMLSMPVLFPSTLLKRSTAYVRQHLIHHHPPFPLYQMASVCLRLLM
jgi:hypothetical protein